MRSWDDYKKTMRGEAEQFAHARAGDVDGLRRLISPRTVDNADAKGYTALMLAAYHGHVEAARFLLDAGAGPDSRDASGNTILMGVAFKGHLEVAQLLAAYNVDVEARNPKGQTALHFAQMFGRSEVANYLKSRQHKPPGFGVRDVLAGWSSFLFPQVKRARKNWSVR